MGNKQYNGTGVDEKYDDKTLVDSTSTQIELSDKIASNASELIKKMENDKIEYLRFEQCNICSQSYGYLVAFRNCDKFLKKGMHAITWININTINSTMCTDTLSKTGLGNALCFPYYDTYKVIPWLNNTASIMIYQEKKYDTIYPCDARSICLNQLRKLQDDFELNLFSSFEHEFTLLDKNGNIPLKDVKSCGYGLSKIEVYQHFFTNIVEKNLFKMGIDCERIHGETALSQYEITTKPKWNIYSADDAYWIRNGLYSMARQDNKIITYIPLIYTDLIDEANSLHFNFSLWNITKDVNILFDDESNYNLSIIGQYFIGGILKHIEGITAFCCPTSDCYKRFDSDSCWSISNGCWSISSRLGLIRAEIGSDNTYFELRLPSSLANPYLVIASIVCGGINGIQNKIIPPNPINTINTINTIINNNDDEKKCDDSDDGNFKIQLLPKNMNDALIALEKDTVLCQGLGTTFINYYIASKRLEIKEKKELDYLLV